MVDFIKEPRKLGAMLAAAGLRGLIPVVLGIALLILPATSWWSTATDPLWVSLGGLILVVAGCVLSLCDLVVDLRRQSREARNLETELGRARSRADELQSRLKSVESERSTLSNQLLRSVEESTELAERDRERRSREARKRFRRAMHTTTSGTDDAGNTLHALLDAIVSVCETSPRDRRRPSLGGFTDLGYFWVKVYTLDRECNRLTPAAASSGAPRGVMRYSLGLGKGGVGQHIKQVLEQPPADTDRPGFYSYKEMSEDLSDDQREQLDAVGIQSVLCAPVYARESVKGDLDGEQFRRVKPEELLGALCFCSRLPPRETTLQDPTKQNECRMAAKLVGVLTHRMRVDSTKAALPTGAKSEAPFG